MANTKDNGMIRILQYNNDPGNCLLTPFVEELAGTARIGSTCALVNTNDQALQIAGMLQNRNVPAKLIQTNEGFRLSDLVELRFFIDQLQTDSDNTTIDQENWEEACQALRITYSRSSIHDKCLKLIKNFEILHPSTRYMTDLITYIRESKLEVFDTDEIDTIYVGTIHKAKGKEFDNVHLLLDKKYMKNLNAEKNRLLYVGFTRARSKLVIHTNDHYLDRIKTDKLERIADPNTHPLPSEIASQASHKAVWLDYFINNQRQRLLNELQCGDQLIIHDGGCQNKQGQTILKFSSLCREEIKKMSKLGFVPQYAKVGFVIFWKKEEADNDCKIVLPELHYTKLVPAARAEQRNEKFSHRI